MNDDIEILDIFDNKKNEAVKKVESVAQVKPNMNNTKKDISVKKKKKLKTKPLQIVFCSISALFILGCIIFYGSRFIKYYRIYNPKVDSSDGSVLLAKDIVGKSEFDIEASEGLFTASGNYIYKGNVKDNYLKYNNMLWRIIRINADNTIEIILDDYISLLPWNNDVTSFDKSQIYDYLNNDFLNNIDKDLLVKNSFCEDILNELGSNNKCEKQNLDSYIKLLDVTNFLNSVKSQKSYIVSDDEILWLSDYSEDTVWHTNGVNVSKSNANTFYEIRPVVKLKNTVTYTKGDGTIDNPFIVGSSDDKIGVGSTVILGEDKWIVYNIDNNIKLMKEEMLTKKDVFSKESLNYDESSLKEYLNGEFLNSLSYKDNLESVDWYIGEYTDKIFDVKNKKVNAKVGIPNILDIKFNSKINGYFTSTNNNEAIWVYENPLRPSKVTTMRGIRPCVAISKEFANKLKSVDGVFKMEEK